AAKANDAIAALERWRLHLLGTHGQVTQLLRAIGKQPADQRKAFGMAVQASRDRLEAAYRDALDAAEQARLGRQLAAEHLDVTLPGRPLAAGVPHPTIQAMNDILRAFANLGFQAVEGPEVEWDFFNFQALNIPPDHPARDMWDTLWVDDRMLLRTHTSPMQVRYMREHTPPLRVIIPGRVYRYEQLDATHESQFYQFEGLMVDEHVSFADLKGVLTDVARQLFGAQRRTRFRCDYFPFVEPGAEMAIDCFLCGGKDAACRVCKGSGWLEILGAGMVHPKVLEYGGLDPSRYRGFAFGTGIERIAMPRYGIEDIRLFYQNDLRFLRQLRVAPAVPPSWEREAAW
ncbi:MAG TPA: phenylalanine--tRNA ligase subunit alpha, partial [Chloroflexota bacterium]|nr:phenylalanine--tRNA ligase subunit alpha [Chloroflexota bacterium]